MKNRKRIGVLGMVATLPFAGMAWMHCQYLVGLARLGYDVYYFETTGHWPYDPHNWTKTDDPSYSLAYLARVLESFGLGDRWAVLATYGDGRWHGPCGPQANDLLRSSDAVFNITASTRLDEIPVPCRLVYIGTDPVIQELRFANGDAELRERLLGHSAHFTYGENIGTPDCPVPPLPVTTWPTRQPVVLDLWEPLPPTRPAFTTVTNWETTGYDVPYQGEIYTWSKHREYLKIIDLPRRTSATLELALGSSGGSPEVKRMLRDYGWAVADAYHMSLDPWPYREYIRTSGGELSVAKDMVVRTRCGWFSERSACYLAAGRPVITQDTGFSRVLPTGEGLFAFRNADEALTALDAVCADRQRHCRAARAIAEEYFKAETVLAKILDRLGL